MSITKTGIPKGTRDFNPTEMLKRNFIFDTIKNVFKNYGYLPIETPAMENLTTLTGKYGEEGDKLLFKILNSGDFAAAPKDDVWSERNSNRIAPLISEKGLRYDLTVPFARFVVQYQSDIAFPFKRYQIQPVWRADRPQKGRYREFYQCDADVIGSDSLLNEVELIQIISDVYKKLHINVIIKMNNRKILSGIAEYIGQTDKIVDITVAIDKLDKIGLENVNNELKEKGIADDKIEMLQPIILLKGSNDEKIEVLRSVLKNSEIGQKGLDEVTEILTLCQLVEVETTVELDLTLARGLDYYTGAIFEVKALDAVMGSICGGGRYDNLTGVFGLAGVSGVGISFGADRIYDVMLQLNLFPENTHSATELLFVNFGENEGKHCLKLLKAVRAKNISAELFPEAAKLKKQMNYANRKGVKYVALIGETEMAENTIQLKNMANGTQTKCTLDEMIRLIKS